MNDIVIGTYDDAKALVESYIPLFCQLNNDDTCNMGIISTTLSDDINDEFPGINVSMPNIDACRFLSMKYFDDFDIEYVEFEGVTIPIGSVDDIIEMKQSTIDYLGKTLRNNP